MDPYLQGIFETAQTGLRTVESFEASLTQPLWQRVAVTVLAILLIATSITFATNVFPSIESRMIISITSGILALPALIAAFRLHNNNSFLKAILLWKPIFQGILRHEFQAVRNHFEGKIFKSQVHDVLTQSANTNEYSRGIFQQYFGFCFEALHEKAYEGYKAIGPGWARDGNISTIINVWYVPSILYGAVQTNGDRELAIKHAQAACNAMSFKNTDSLRELIDKARKNALPELPPLHRE